MTDSLMIFRLYWNNTVRPAYSKSAWPYNSHEYRLNLSSLLSFNPLYKLKPLWVLFCFGNFCLFLLYNLSLLKNSQILTSITDFLGKPLPIFLAPLLIFPPNTDILSLNHKIDVHSRCRSEKFPIFFYHKHRRSTKVMNLSQNGIFKVILGQIQKAGLLNRSTV